MKGEEKASRLSSCEADKASRLACLVSSQDLEVEISISARTEKVKREGAQRDSGSSEWDAMAMVLVSSQVA